MQVCTNRIAEELVKAYFDGGNGVGANSETIKMVLERIKEFSLTITSEGKV